MFGHALRALSVIAVTTAPLAPLVAQTTQPAAVTAASPASAYRVNAGDELEIYVWGEERLKRNVRVLPDGSIAFPLIGQIPAQGRTLTELQNTITQALSGQYRGQVPQVTVSVVNPSGLQFSVMGRVKGPGTFSPGRNVNVLEALSLAGGPTEFANLDNIMIVRKTGDNITTVRVKLGDVFRSADRLDNSTIMNIQTGDTVIVR